MSRLSFLSYNKPFYFYPVHMRKERLTREGRERKQGCLLVGAGVAVFGDISEFSPNVFMPPADSRSPAPGLAAVIKSSSTQHTVLQTLEVSLLWNCLGGSPRLGGRCSCVHAPGPFAQRAASTSLSRAAAPFLLSQPHPNLTFKGHYLQAASITSAQTQLAG